MSTTITPPYSVYLADYVSAESNSLRVLINLMELDRTNYRVKLRVTLKGAGIALSTKPGYVPPPVILQGGVPELLTGFDLRHYFNPDNLDFSGISRSEFIQRGRLPEGFYTLKIEVLDYNRNVIVSNASRANAWLMFNDPPFINYPFNGDKIVATDPQNITFSWTPRHTASPNAAFSTEYEFKLVEMYPGQSNPEVAIRSSNSLFTTTTTQTSLNYGVIAPTLIPGKKYAFRIRAYDSGGRDLFKNNGFSETYMFQYGDDCKIPTEIEAEALDPNRVRFQWQSSQIHSGFNVQYRKEGQDDWFLKETVSVSQIIPELSGGTTYEYRLQAKCGTILGDYSPVFTVSTPKTDENAFVCGADMEGFNINPNPLQEPLLPGDQIKTADWNIRIESVSASGEMYSGDGYAEVPLFNKAKIRVTFDGIKVNEDYRVIEGNVKTIWSENSRFVADLRAKETVPVEDSGEDAPTDTTSEGDSAPVVIDSTIVVAGDIDSISINEEGVVIVVMEDGTTKSFPSDKNGETVITDSSGDQWVANSDGNISTPASSPTLSSQTVGEGASGDNLEEGEVKFGPVTAYFDEKPQSVGKDENGYCIYENIRAELDLTLNSHSINQSFTIPDVSISFTQHCESKAFKDVSINYENPDGFEIEDVGFIEAAVTSISLGVDEAGKISGGINFSAGLKEDRSVSEVFIVKKGLTGSFSYRYSGEDSFLGTLDLSGLEGVKVEMWKSSKLIASIDDASFEGDVFTGNLKVSPGVVDFETSYFKATVKSLSVGTSYSFDEGFSLLNGSATLTLSQLKGLRGSLDIGVSYNEGNTTIAVTSGSLEGFGMEFSKLDLSGAIDENFELEILEGTFQAKHPDFGSSLSVTKFLYTQGGLQTFNANGSFTYNGVNFNVGSCEYSAEDQLIALDASVNISQEGVDVAAKVDGFTIDKEGNVNYEAVSVKSDITLGPLAIKFEAEDGPERDRKRLEDGTRIFEFSGDATILVKTIGASGKEQFKEVSKVSVNYRTLRDKEETLVDADLLWSGELGFGTIQGVDLLLSKIDIHVDENGNLTGGLHFAASLKEDKVVRDIFVLKKGLNGNIKYHFGGEKSYAGSFDLSGIRNINVVAKKGDNILASLSKGSFNGTIFTGTFEALPNASYSSNSFDLKVDELKMNASYDFTQNHLEVHSGKGRITAENIQGINGKLVLGIEYGVDENFTATISNESELSAFGFSFSELNLLATFTENFDLTEVTGSVKANHNQLKNDFEITTFTLENGKLKEINASGSFIYKGFDFDLEAFEYADEKLLLTADLAINATGTEAQFGVDDFQITTGGEIGLRKVSGNLKRGNHLVIGFDVEMNDTRFTGSFDGKIKTIGVGISGNIDIGKESDYTFAYLELVGDVNVTLGTTGLKITKLGGQVGYNYALTYNASTNEFSGDPKHGNYVLGLTLGLADVAELCEIVGNPIVQFSSSSLSVSLDGTLQITKDHPLISSQLQAQYELPDNTLAASINTNIQIPKNSGAIFDANCAVSFGVADNLWHANAENISATFLRSMKYSGGFYYGGKLNEFTVDEIRLKGNVDMAFAFSFDRDFGFVELRIGAAGSVNSYINAELSVDRGLMGEVGVGVTCRLTCEASFFGYDFDPVYVDANASGRVGFDNGKGYIKGDISASIQIDDREAKLGPRNYNYKFSSI